MSDGRARICAAAREIFLREGAQSVSMRRVAESAGVTAPAIYRHFRSKDELLGEIVGTGLGILEEYLKPALKARDPYTRLNRLIDRYLDFALEQPKYFDLAFLVPTSSTRLSMEIRGHDRTTFGFAIAQITECIERGIFAPADPLETAVTLWATAHGLVTFYRLRRLGVPEREFRKLYRRTIDRVLAGMKA